MLDRTVLLLREEYPIATCHVTDRLERARQEAPPLGLGAPKLGIVLQHLRRVALGVEGDRNKGDPGAEIRSQRVLYVHHLLGQHPADIRAAGVDEGQRYDLAAQVGKGYRRAVVR